MRLTSDGAVYYPSDAERKVGGIRVAERQRPLRPLTELLEPHLEGMRKYVDQLVVRPVDFITTEEGEYAAFTTMSGIGKADGKPILCSFGLVFGDAWYDRLDGWMTDEARFDSFLVAAREAVEKHVLFLGSGRARRFYYIPPPGWQGLQRDLLTEWYPLDYPRHHSVIAVPPAFRKGIVAPSASTEVIMGRRSLNFQKDRPGSVETVMLNGMGGVLRHDVGHYNLPGHLATNVLTAAFHDEEMANTYVARLETTDEFLEQDRKHLYTIVKSMRALPGPAVSKTTTNDSAAQMMWAD